MTHPSDVQAAFCAVLCDEWARAGVTDAVVAPGSRSTPMVAALESERRIRVHVVLDERSAGFVALGLGVSTRRPALVVTTSGTASVELHPAVVEASQAAVPLIALTTDRPPELHLVGAAQTVEQRNLFLDAVRWAVDPGVADLASAASWRSVAARCVTEAMGRSGGPGPVHLNLQFREPLLGDAGAVEWPPGRPDGRPWHAAAAGRADPEPAVLDEAVATIVAAAGGRGLIVAGEGAGPADAVLDVAARLGWPVLAEPRSGARLPEAPVVAAADALLRADPVAGWTPDVVVRFGAPWASKVMGQWLAGLPPEVPQIVADSTGRWIDPDRRASLVITGGVAGLAGALAGKLRPAARPTAWLERWMRAEVAAQRVLDDNLGRGAPLDMSEPAVARACLDQLPSGGQLVASSSMPVRDVEWFGRPRRGVRVLSNRGANGIDGVLSTSIGAALGSGGPTVALIGDLAFLYDASALLWAARRPVALSVVVVDNDGGGIFSFLPQASVLERDRFERYWGTPHGTDLVALSAAYGVEALRVERRDELDGFLSVTDRPGVRVAVVPSDRRANVEVHDRLNAATAAAVAGLGAS